MPKKSSIPPPQERFFSRETINQLFPKRFKAESSHTARSVMGKSGCLPKQLIDVPVRLIDL